MKIIDASGVEYKTLNEQIKESVEDVTVKNCMGQRYMASALSGKKVVIEGIPGNALGAYMDGAEVEVFGNVQDAVGDTMNEGRIVIHGNSGDALGYAMRGGEIFVKGYSGYRTGVHMKEYKEKKPVIVIGENCGSFLGEYLAGGIIIVLGLSKPKNIVGNFVGVGMHSGKIYLRCEELPDTLPAQVTSRVATREDIADIETIIDNYCKVFNLDRKAVLDSKFYVLEPNSTNPYKRLYTYN